MSWSTCYTGRRGVVPESYHRIVTTISFQDDLDFLEDSEEVVDEEESNPIQAASKLRTTPSKSWNRKQFPETLNSITEKCVALSNSYMLHFLLVITVEDLIDLESTATTTDPAFNEEVDDTIAQNPSSLRLNGGISRPLKARRIIKNATSERQARSVEFFLSRLSLLNRVRERYMTQTPASKVVGELLFSLQLPFMTPALAEALRRSSVRFHVVLVSLELEDGEGDAAAEIDDAQEGDDGGGDDDDMSVHSANSIASMNSANSGTSNSRKRHSRRKKKKRVKHNRYNNVPGAGLSAAELSAGAGSDAIYRPLESTCLQGLMQSYRGIFNSRAQIFGSSPSRYGMPHDRKTYNEQKFDGEDADADDEINSLLAAGDLPMMGLALGSCIDENQVDWILAQLNTDVFYPTLEEQPRRLKKKGSTLIDGDTNSISIISADEEEMAAAMAAIDEEMNVKTLEDLRLEKEAQRRQALRRLLPELVSFRVRELPNLRLRAVELCHSYGCNVLLQFSQGYPPPDTSIATVNASVRNDHELREDDHAIGSDVFNDRKLQKLHIYRETAHNYGVSCTTLVVQCVLQFGALVGVPLLSSTATGSGGDSHEEKTALHQLNGSVSSTMLGGNSASFSRSTRARTRSPKASRSAAAGEEEGREGAGGGGGGASDGLKEGNALSDGDVGSTNRATTSASKSKKRTTSAKKGRTTKFVNPILEVQPMLEHCSRLAHPFCSRRLFVSTVKIVSLHISRSDLDQIALLSEAEESGEVDRVVKSFATNRAEPRRLRY